MDFKVLVVDDQIETRKDDYKYFAKCFAKETNSNLLFEYLDHPGHIDRILSEYYWDAIISDVVLNGSVGWEDFTLDSLFTHINNAELQDIPLLLLSEVWNVTNADLINRALAQKQWKGFIHYRDICKADKENSDVVYPVSQLFAALKQAKNIGGINQKLTKSDDIRILHLSDLQHGGFVDDDLYARTQLAIDEILTYWEQKPPHFICISGDIAEHGLPEEYAKAAEWLEYIEKQLEYPVIYCVPGNHDICIPIAGATRLNLVDAPPKNKKLALSSEEESIPHKSLFQYSVAPFKNFWNSFSDIKYLDDTLPSAPWVDSSYRHLGVLFYGFNTAIPTAFGLPDRHACSVALRLITTELQEIKKNHKDCCTIGIMHHSPIPVQDGESIANTDNFGLSFKGSIKTNIICHGHQHTWKITPQHLKKYQMLISQAQTFSKSDTARPEDSLRGFNLLTLKRKNNIVDGVKAATCSLDGTDFLCREHKDIEEFFGKFDLF